VSCRRSKLFLLLNRRVSEEEVQEINTEDNKYCGEE
jgi:hypothetical protein